MSSGTSGAVQFQLNKNNATRGVFFQREKPKSEHRKFGYKSKNLRHPIRQPDYQEELERVQQEAEEEKRKFNKRNTDFIRKNRERYRPKEDSGQPPPGTTHIAPGTVTLTQDQLAALLKTLGKTSQGGGGGGGDSPLRISIDPESNKIEVERYESDSNADNDNGTRSDDHGNDDNGLDVGIEALLNGDTKPQTKTKKIEEPEEKRRSRSALKSRDGHHDKVSVPKPTNSSGNPDRNSPRPAGTTSQTRLSWEDAKKEAGVSHVPDVVPWKHLTVGERKRLQWAREKADVAEDYNPWGRPGAGAPAQKQAEEARTDSRQPNDWISKGPSRSDRASKAEEAESSNLKKKEELANEILKIQQEIREAEEKRRKEEEKLKENKKQNEADREKRVGKQDSQHNKKTRRDKSQGDPKKKEAASEDDKKENQDNEEAHLSKKEIERRKWVAELDKQREEQRMKKQQEKEREKAGLQDQWADRFVYHKSPRHVQPDQTSGSVGPQGDRSRNQGSVLGRARSPQDTLENAPPAAMRSSMVVGGGSLNENRYDNKKAEEKRKWLQELEQQREEQRLARQTQKERDRQENNGTWADHYQTDRHKLDQNVPHRLGQLVQEKPSHNNSFGQQLGGSPRTASNNAGVVELERATAAQRTTSAPHPTVAPPAAEEGTTFLRGQGAFVDPVTRSEQEEKRRVHLEYQAQIKAQIEEKERQKREERERKVREDMEEERKLLLERDQFNQQIEMEQKKLREREEQRQKQIAALKTAMDEAQERALEEKTHKRIHHLQQHGHDVTALKATYDEPSVNLGVSKPPQAYVSGESGVGASPRVKQYDVSAVPGLGLSSGHQNQPPSSPPIKDLIDSARFEPAKQEPQAQPRYPLGQSYTKEPYVEDRVLTPSRFRGQGRAQDPTDSPRREFGTQTLELKELQNILNSLPEDIQIEYKLKVEDALREKEERARGQKKTQQQQQQPHPRKVHVKGGGLEEEVADRRRPGGGKPPQAGKPGAPTAKRQVKEKEPPPRERLAWNQKQRKKVLKNSERDPFYEQKKEQAEVRRARRERQLQYLQELNSENIPSLQQHSRSKSRHEHCSPRRGDGETDGAATEQGRGRKVANSKFKKDDHDDSTRLQNRSHSPNVLSLLNIDNDEGMKIRRGNRSKSPAPRNPISTGRNSPPIPTVRHRTGADPGTERDPYAHANRQLRDSQSDTRYGDAAILPVSDGEFVPFMRTTEILDPARAEEPMAMSRENSRMERARRAYRDTHNPAGQGRRVEVYQDREREAALKASQPQNPLLNPGLVTDHPTARQDMILQQLSSLKQTLMQRQKELETYMTPAELEAEGVKG